MNGFDTCVVLAAGRGSRMGGETPKVLLEVGGKPVLQHIIDYWKPFVTDFVFVVGYKWEMVTDYIASTGLDHWTFVLQPQQKGIADAVRQAKIAVQDKFIVALGDCLNVGTFEPFPSDLDQGYAYWNNQYLNAVNHGCSVDIDWKGNVVAIEEKPNVRMSGMGVYWFDKKVFKYINETPVSPKRNEVEISDTIKLMIQSGEKIKAIRFNGEPVNCTTPDDIEYAEKLLDMRVRV